MASKYVDINSSMFFSWCFLMGMAYVLHGCGDSDRPFMPELHPCNATQKEEFGSAEESCLKKINVASCEDTDKAMKKCFHETLEKVGCHPGREQFDHAREIEREVWEKIPEAKTSLQTDFKACLEKAEFEGKDCDAYNRKYMNCYQTVQTARDCPSFWLDEVANTTIPEATWYWETCSTQGPKNLR